MYSIGKDSSVLLHLARKAFFPGRIPFPLLHIDTGWKFREMIAFRDETAKRLNAELIVHTNEAGKAAGVTPFTHGGRYTDIMKTEALKAGARQVRLDAAFGGARRDEEKSRAKERVFSFRDTQHRWDPKNQRPGAVEPLQRPPAQGREHPRVPAVELDRDRHLALHPRREHPGRAAVLRQAAPGRGPRRAQIMVDDDRMPLKAGEKPHLETVRFRSLGCYPLSGAQVSKADTVPAIIEEMLRTTHFRAPEPRHRRGPAAAMEKRKREGYF